MIHIRWGSPKKVYAFGYYKSLFGAYKDKYLTSLYPSHALVSWLTFYEAWTIVWFSQKCINYVSVPFTICVFYKAVRKTSFSINWFLK